MIFTGFLRGFSDYLPNIRNKRLLDLCMEVYFRFFDKDNLAKRPFIFGSHPLQMKMADLYRHIDEIFEA